nr:MAG TPA: hypothetical protein [Caudoviricetes sp.]
MSKISALVNILKAESDDILPIVDVSEGVTKKATVEQLLKSNKGIFDTKEGTSTIQLPNYSSSNAYKVEIFDVTDNGAFYLLFIANKGKVAIISCVKPSTDPNTPTVSISETGVVTVKAFGIWYRQIPCTIECLN